MSSDPTKEVPINATVDFERAKERLEALAGREFRAWQKIKHDPSASPAEVNAAAMAYQQADDAAKALRRTDEESIRQILDRAL